VSSPNAQQEPVEEQGPGRPAPRSKQSWMVRRWAHVRATAEAGMSTAEYAVGTVAACAFAAVLYRVVTGDSIVAGLTRLVDSALATLS
jgi:hypothetical protein